MEERPLNEKESLELISQMIRNTQQRLEKGNGMPFLVWGYTTVIVSFLVWYMVTSTKNYHWNFLWFLIPIISMPTMLLLIKKKDKSVKTYVDKVISYIWTVFGIAAFSISCIAAFYWKINIPILFMVILLMGMGTALTGLVIRFRPIVISGFLGMALSVLCLFVNGSNQILVFAALFLVIQVIPGHILNYKSKRNHV